MRFEYRGDKVNVGCFSDLVITTSRNELLYASIKGFDSSVQAVKSACYSKKEESFYLSETSDCIGILGEGKHGVPIRERWIPAAGTFRGFLAKEEDLTHAEMVHVSCLETHEKPVLIAWDGDVLGAFTRRLSKNYPYPLMKEWMWYLYEELERNDFIGQTKVYSTSEPQLRAFQLTAKVEDIEEIVLRGFREGILHIPEGEKGETEIDHCRNVTDYLTNYGSALAKSLAKAFRPRHMIGDPLDSSMHSLLRKPFKSQADAIQGLSLTLGERNSAICVGEMGTGKSLVGSAVAYLLKAKNTLVMCPGHLTVKWKREIENTIPNAEVKIAEGYQDVFHIREEIEIPSENPRVYIFSKDMAKLSFFRRRATRWNQRRGGWICPDCGTLQVYEKGKLEGLPLEYEDFEFETEANTKCCHCGTKLWSADNQMAERVAPADLLKKYLKGKFDLFIADELHKFKGQTAQGNAFGAFMAAAKKTLGLTGTLLGGYASDIYRILFRMNPKLFLKKGMDFNSTAKFSAEYGVLERTYKNEESIKNRASRGSSRQVKVKELPGISPKVFGEFLLDMCVFLEMGDITDQLPSYNEYVEVIEMDPELEDAYQRMATVLKDELDRSMQWGNGRMLGTYLNNLLSYPDKPFENEAILRPNTDEVIYTPIELDQEGYYHKEQRLLELVKEEKRKGRRCLVFATFTGKRKDVTKRLQEIFFKEGIKAAVLRSNVSPSKREEWLTDKVWRGYDVVIANPILVETGLDCLDFPTIIFHQTGYSIFTLRQASRRSWRIGQTVPVKVYFLAYKDTLQEAAIRLIGAKMEASLALEGRFSEEGLRMMGAANGQDLGTALAKALLEGIKDIDSAEAIWGRMGYGTINDEVVKDEEKTTEQPSVETVVPADVGIVEVEVALSRKIEMKVAVIQLGWNFGFETGFKAI